jgi:caa(3)-type oxidase subunit IV
MTDQHHFNPQRIFIILFVLTALEVAWGTWIPYDIKWLLWGGLLIFAFWKGLLIFMYFMHMKFEGWVVKALIAPTPALIAIVFFALLPDVASNDRLVYDVGDQYDPAQGKVVEIGNATNDPREHGAKLIGPDGELRDAHHGEGHGSAGAGH